jgi:hypothetical protein
VSLVQHARRLRSTIPAPWRRRLLLALTRRVPRLFTLEKLGAIHGTDKVDRWHTHLGRTNAAVYEPYVRDWRRDAFSLLEIGVLHGNSLRMWHAYFPKACVCGLDIDPKAAALTSEGFEIAIGSQADPTVLDPILERHGADLRLVIDDGSHVNELTMATFDHVFPELSSGAVYVIEDLLCSYEPALASWPGMEHNPPDLSLENDRGRIDRFLVELARDADLGDGRWSSDGERSVAFVHVWPGVIVVGRA